MKPSLHEPARPTVVPVQGFTLVELLVVLAVTGILASLLMPTLHSSKTSARKIGCASNLKQLQLCAALYGVDFEDSMPPNNSLTLLSSGSALASGISWCTNYARYDVRPDGILNGVLFPYNSSLEIYRCPADLSKVESRTGAVFSVRRWRSYNLSQSVNGYPEYDAATSAFMPSFRTFSEINNPSASELISFVEVHEDSIEDTVFGIPTKAYGGSSRYWWDIPSGRHAQSGTFSFADGRVETLRWKVPKVVRQRYAAQYVPEVEMPDYQRVQAGVRQLWE